MASTSFIQRVKTELNIMHNHYDTKLSPLIDEALDDVNSYLDTAVTEDTITSIQKRALFIYIAWKLDGNDLSEAYSDQLAKFRDV